MTSTVLYRIVGTTLLVAAILSALAALLTPQGDPKQAVGNPLFYADGIVALLAGMAVVACLPGIRAYAGLGWLGLVAVAVLMAPAMLFLVALPFAQIAIFPWVASLPISQSTLEAGPASLFITFISANLVAMVGGVILGVALARSGRRLLGIGFAALFVVSTIMSFVGPQDGPLGSLGQIAVMLALGCTAVDMIRSTMPAHATQTTAEMAS